MTNFSEIQDNKYFRYDFENKGNKWSVLLSWGKYNYVSVTKKTNNPFGTPFGKEFKSIGDAVDNYKDANIQANILFAGNEAKKYGYTPKYSLGGEIDFSDYSNDALTEAIINLSRYENTQELIQILKEELAKRKDNKNEFSKGGDVDEMPNEIIGNDNIKYIKVKTHKNPNGKIVVNYEGYWNGYIVDGFWVDNNIKELNRYIENRILSTNQYNRLKHLPIKELPKYRNGGNLSNIQLNDWVADKKGGARGQVYWIEGNFVKLKDKYGNLDNKMYYLDNLKQSSKPRFAEGGKLKRYPNLSEIKPTMVTEPEKKKDWEKIYNENLNIDNDYSWGVNKNSGREFATATFVSPKYDAIAQYLKEGLNEKGFEFASISTAKTGTKYIYIDGLGGGRTIRIADHKGRGDVFKPTYEINNFEDAKKFLATKKTKKQEDDELKNQREIDNERQDNKNKFADEIAKRNLVFKKNERTYQTPEVFMQKNPEITHLKVKELGKNSFGEMAFEYQFLAKKKPNEYTGTLPSFEFIEWFNETKQKFALGGSVTQTGLFENYTPVKPTIISKKPRKEQGVLENQISEIDIVRLGVTTLPSEKDKKIMNSQDAVKILYDIFPKDKIAVQEFYYVLFLNNNNSVIAYYNLSKGGVTSTIADIELIASAGVKLLAKGVIVAHNHPSGNLKPSDADINITKETRKALKLLGILLMDSIIIVPNGDLKGYNYTSLMDEGLI